MDFEALNWHDSTLRSLTWKCSDEGEDSIIIELSYIIDYEGAPKRERRAIRFLDCRKLMVDTNLGLMAPESLLDGNVDRGRAYESFRSSCEKIGLPVDGFSSFNLITNTSGSKIEIVAKSWSWVP